MKQAVCIVLLLLQTSIIKSMEFNAANLATAELTHLETISSGFGFVMADADNNGNKDDSDEIPTEKPLLIRTKKTFVPDALAESNPRPQHHIPGTEITHDCCDTHYKKQSASE